MKCLLTWSKQLLTTSKLGSKARAAWSCGRRASSVTRTSLNLRRLLVSRRRLGSPYGRPRRRATTWRDSTACRRAVVLRGRHASRDRRASRIGARRVVCAPRVVCARRVVVVRRPTRAALDISPLVCSSLPSRVLVVSTIVPRRRVRVVSRRRLGTRTPTLSTCSGISS